MCLAPLVPGPFVPACPGGFPTGGPGAVARAPAGISSLRWPRREYTGRGEEPGSPFPPRVRYPAPSGSRAA